MIQTSIRVLLDVQKRENKICITLLTRKLNHQKLGEYYLNGIHNLKLRI